MRKLLIAAALALLGGNAKADTVIVEGTIAPWLWNGNQYYLGQLIDPGIFAPAGTSLTGAPIQILWNSDPYVTAAQLRHILRSSRSIPCGRLQHRFRRLFLRYQHGRSADVGARSHRRCWTAGADLGERWPSWLVATAAEDDQPVGRDWPVPGLDDTGLSLIQPFSRTP